MVVTANVAPVVDVGGGAVVVVNAVDSVGVGVDVGIAVVSNVVVMLQRFVPHSHRNEGHIDCNSQ